MSHVVTIRSKLQDPISITAACRRLHLPEPYQGTASLFGTEASGIIVQLPSWQYPVVIDVSEGSIRYDNYEGKWKASA